MSQANQPPTVTYDPSVPADNGLSALGLLMQLAGSVFAGIMCLYAFLLIGGANLFGQTGWLLLVLVACVGRSLVHRWAGTELLYGKRTTDELGDPLAPVRKYIAVGLAHSALLTLLLIGKFDMPMKYGLAFGGALALWPAALAILLQQPRFQSFRTEIPVPEDKGFEGVAILMVVLGAIGLLCSGTVLIVMLEADDILMRHGHGVPMIGATLMLVIRSGLHVHAGLTGLRETSLERAAELANRYANFGVITSFCVGAALLITMFRVAFHPVAIAFLAGVCWMLLAWPLIIRRFFSERQFADLLAGDKAEAHRRAPDAGLTSLGWLLFAYSIYGATMLLPQLVAGQGEGLMSELFSSPGETSLSVWLGAGVLVLQAWAGLELIRMSASSKVIATVYALAAAAIAIYTTLPVLDALDELFAMSGGPLGMLSFVPLGVSLVLPVVTLLLVNRKIAPTATARFRPRTPEG